ncbi:hypothetical protein Taro_031925 [Colocasia esculenta]|uniref:C2 domain-containing protein n=1 Tax=Colocasia esculenta TaxID=4460 RepID=A0A843W7W6_COLES|nr:hypothetical protein [Colocasia esculenta]
MEGRRRRRRDRSEKMMQDKLASLEITVLSAEDLTHSRRPVKKNAFVIVRTGSRTHASTSPHTDGGSFPRWNQKLRLSLPRSSRSIAVEVRCKTGPDERVLGEVSIPVSEFYGSELRLPSDYLHFLSYRLRDRRGERNGIINLSIRAHGVQVSVHRPAPAPAFYSRAPGRPDSAGVAVGIPMPSYRYTA